MNTTKADSITSNIKTLRENVYNKEEFKTKFSSELKSNIAAIETKYVADELGGWNVEVTLDRKEAESKGIELQMSENYLNGVNSSLLNSIKECGQSGITEKSGLANVIISGEDSITIKI